VVILYYFKSFKIKIKKIMMFESRRVKMKKNGKKHVVQKKRIFFITPFWLVLWLCISK